MVTGSSFAISTSSRLKSLQVILYPPVYFKSLGKFLMNPVIPSSPLFFFRPSTHTTHSGKTQSRGRPQTMLWDTGEGLDSFARVSEVLHFITILVFTIHSLHINTTPLYLGTKVNYTPSRLSYLRVRVPLTFIHYHLPSGTHTCDFWFLDFSTSR